MNNKVLVSINVPILESTYDVYIPVFKNIQVCTKLISKTINELTYGHFPLSDNYILINESGEVLDNNKTVKESNIKNGTTVFLIQKV